MEVHLNHQLQEAQDGATLRQFLSDLGLEESSGLAIAINDQVIPKTQWQSHALQPQDQITIIRATQGG